MPARPIPFHASPSDSRRSAAVRIVQRSGFSFESESSSHSIGIATGARGFARTPYGRDAVLGVGDPVDVDVDPRAALVAMPLEREPLRVVGDHRLGDRARVGVRVAVVVSAAQRADDVHAARAGDHRERHQRGVAQALAGLARRRAHGREADAGVGIEVEDQAVGLARAIGSREPDVRGDDVLPSQVDERGRVVGDRLGQRAVSLADLGALDPIRKVVRNRLHVVAALVDAGREHLERQRSVADVRQHRLGHPLVMAGEVELGDPRAREQRLAGARDLDRAPTDTDRFACHAYGSGGSRSWSAGVKKLR